MKRSKKIINTDNWNRKEHFDFFSAFDEPFYCITARVECSRAYSRAKQEGVSFFIYYLHKALAAVNDIEELITRIEEENIVIYDRINVSATIARKDKTFAFSYIEYDPDINIFKKNAEKEIVRIQENPGLLFNPEKELLDVVHFSSLPWISFTGLTHARNYNDSDSVPKITFGRMTESDGRKQMPVSIMVHHGLVDGYHLSRYINMLQALLDNKHL